MPDEKRSCVTRGGAAELVQIRTEDRGGESPRSTTPSTQDRSGQKSCATRAVANGAYPDRGDCFTQLLEGAQIAR